jgi:hypothetical protein
MLLNECKYITTGFQEGEQFSQIGLKFIHALFPVGKQPLIAYNCQIHLP